MTHPLPLARLPWRLAGVALLAVLVVLYQPTQHDVAQRVLIPTGMALGAWMLVQNLAAVALGGGLLAAIHSAPGSDDWVRAVAYPGLAGLSAVILLAIFVQRFRRRIAATHAARWQQRRTATERK